MSYSQIIIYQTANGQTKLEVRLENETVFVKKKSVVHKTELSEYQSIEQQLFFSD